MIGNRNLEPTESLELALETTERVGPTRRRRKLKIMGQNVTTTPVFEAYWYFAAERQRIFFRRLRRSNRPFLTDDPILASYRFTNSYRASDRVSQFLIGSIIFGDGAIGDPQDLFFRVLLFKLFNKIETWIALENHFGSIDLDSFSFAEADRVLTQRKEAGYRNYSAAYIMPSCGRNFGREAKHSGHLELLQWMLHKEFPTRIQNSATMAEAFAILLEAPSIGQFLAYQFATDLNYSPLTNFSEMEFVVAGPGAIDGIAKCFEEIENLEPTDIIHYMAENQENYLSDVAGGFPDLWGRPLQLIDCQNLFCEISKYARVAYPEIVGSSGRTRIKQKYKPIGAIETPFYPPSWDLNEKIASSL